MSLCDFEDQQGYTFFWFQNTKSFLRNFSFIYCFADSFAIIKKIEKINWA